ncbi:MAG: heme ABC transporter permease [Alphaproteobacteria bacterium]|nr:heme ABC transporter permease [Alphaproteobacteria bacterium]
MFKFMTPSQLVRMAARLQPIAGAVAAGAIAIGLYYALVNSPPDYQQGQAVRIMYMHVPFAWLATMVYGIMAIFSLVGLIWRHPLAHLACRAAAPLGAVFTGLCLVTGSIWGKPMWGTWWVWDARLSSVLVLFFVYLGYLALVRAFESPEKGERLAAILVVVGSVNLPIIKFSVEWWNSLHQPASVLRLGKPTIDGTILIPLLLLVVGFMGLFVYLWLMNLRSAVIERRLLNFALNERAEAKERS